MAITLKVPENDIISKPVLLVFGVGGAGGNAVNNMMELGLQGVKFVVANTDAQALTHSSCVDRIQLGANLTKGLGAGAVLEIGAEAAEESAEEIKSYIEGANMVFITGGMGGGTCTGAAPVISRIAKELGILTVAIVTKPFRFEGPFRMRNAEKGVARLHEFVDTLIVIDNQNLFRIANERTTFQDAFKMADKVLYDAVQGVTDLITRPGLVNLDFADISTIMSGMGDAMMGTGEASGEDRALKAAEAAIANPLLENNSIELATGVLINVTGGMDMTLFEVDTAANRIRQAVTDNEKANIIFGSTLNPDLNGIIRVSVVATGIKVTSELTSTTHQTTNIAGNIAPTPKGGPAPSRSIDAITQKLNMQQSSMSTKALIEKRREANLEKQDPSIYQNTQSSILESTVDMFDEYGQDSNSIDTQEIFTTRSPVQPKTQEKVVKTSILSKMWNSLKSANDIDSVHNHNDNMSRDFDRDPEEEHQIHEVPTFLRRK